MNPSTAGTASAGAGHGRLGGLAVPRRAPGPGPRSCRYFSGCPWDWWTRCPEAQWEGERWRPVLASLRPRQGRARPGSTDASAAPCPGRTWSRAKGQRSWGWGRGGLLSSPLAPRRGDAVGERCRGGQSPCSCAERGALPSVAHDVCRKGPLGWWPCVSRSLPWTSEARGSPGCGGLAGRPEAAHVDRAAEGVPVASGAGPTKAAGRGHSRALGGKGPRVPSGAQPALGGSWEPPAKSCAA